MLAILFEKMLFFIERYQDGIRDYLNDPHKTVRVLGDYLLRRKNLYFIEEFDLPVPKLHQRIAIDFISTLTDRFAVDAFRELYTPAPGLW